MILLYHMMRTAGFEWLWECDGEVGPNSSNPNHVDDGNMEASDRTRWDDYGSPDVTKDTTQVHSGTKSLKIVTHTAHDGVVSDALLSITNPTTYTGTVEDSLTGPTNGVMVVYDNISGVVGDKANTNCRAVCAGFANSANNGTFLVRDPYYSTTNAGNYMKLENPSGVPQVGLASATIRFERKYEIAIWALVGTGLVDGYWKVEVDPGDGTFIELGQLPLDADWHLSHFSFWAVSTGPRYIRITDTLGGRTCYIDSVSVFRSNFEYAPTNVYGPEPALSRTGVITNPDRFSVSSGYVCGAQDIGKWLFVWDDDVTTGHNKNSGYYKIIADLGAGVVQLDLRSGSAALLTTTTNVRWRIVDVDAQAHNDWPANSQISMGFGLRSPHSSGWRTFMRISYNYEDVVTVWSAPDDEASFDQSTGQFYTDGPSTQRNMTLPYVFSTFTTRQTWSGLYLAGGSFLTRTWFMTDADCSFIAFMHQSVTYAQHAFFFIGYTGADPAHPGIEEFVSMLCWQHPSQMEIGWDSIYYFTYLGIGFNSEKMAVPCSCGYFGWQSNNTVPFNISNSGPNPWSGNEWLLPLCIVRDPDGTYGCYSERDADIGLFMGRTTMANFTTFDSNSLMHIYDSLYMEWSGESII